MVVARSRTALAAITLLLGVISSTAARRIDPDVEATFTKSGRILCVGALP